MDCLAEFRTGNSISRGKSMNSKPNKNVVKYNRWGYIFLLPFVVIYTIFQLIPLINTIYNSFFEHYFAGGGLNEVGPRFVGLHNYIALLTKGGDMFHDMGNTLVMWIIGFIPQIIVSLLLAAWFTDPSLRLKCQQFFKTVIYLPNLIMAAAFAMLFFALFSRVGPVNDILQALHITTKDIDFFSSSAWSRGLVGFMNFLMWFGNTTILLMAGMMGIDTSLFEAAEVDGATSTEIFFKITLPLLKPILIYVLITSLIGGLQMFDVPQILTSGSGAPNETTMTMIMRLNKHLFSRNYGMGGALSVILFIITGLLSLLVFKMTASDEK